MNRISPILLGIIICVFSAQMVHADTIRLAADVWCPYNCKAGEQPPGYLIEIAELIFKRAGHDVVYKNMSWSRAIEETRLGKFNAIVGAYATDAPDFVFPDQPLWQAYEVLVVKRESDWNFLGVPSLSKLTLGAIQGYTYSGELGKYILDNQDNSGRVQLISGDDALGKNIDKLLADRVQVVIDDGAVMHHYLRKNHLEASMREAGRISGGSVYIAFSPKLKSSQKYAELLSAGVLELKQSGEFEKILAKYGLN